MSIRSKSNCRIESMVERLFRIRIPELVFSTFPTLRPLAIQSLRAFPNWSCSKTTTSCIIVSCSTTVPLVSDNLVEKGAFGRNLRIWASCLGPIFCQRKTLKEPNEDPVSLVWNSDERFCPHRFGSLIHFSLTICFPISLTKQNLSETFRMQFFTLFLLAFVALASARERSIHDHDRSVSCVSYPTSLPSSLQKWITISFLFLS